MAQASASGTLPLPIDAAWALLSDLSRFEDWLTIHVAWDGELPELAEGAQVSERLIVMGIAATVRWTIERFAPPTRLSITGTGLAGAEIAFTLAVEPAGEGALVSIAAEFTGPLMVGAIGAAVEKNATGELERSLLRLQDLAA